VIDLSNDEGVRAALREIADWSAVDTAPPVDVLTDAARTHTRVVSLDDRRSRSTARLLGVAAAVVALVAGGLVVLSRRDADPAVGALAGGRWQSMATAPIEPRLAPSSVWTGTAAGVGRRDVVRRLAERRRRLRPRYRHVADDRTPAGRRSRERAEVRGARAGRVRRRAGGHRRPSR